MLKSAFSNAGLGVKILAFCLLFLIFYQKVGPLGFHPVHPGLDPSWQAAIAYGLDRGLVAGTDIVFTGGPLSTIYNRQFSPVFAYRIAILSLLIVIFLAVAWTRLVAHRNKVAYIGLLILTLWLTIISNDSLLLLVPLATAIHGLNKEPAGGVFLTWAGALLSGIVALAKFSVFPLAVLAMLVLDVAAASKKRLPLHLLILAAGLSCGFIIMDQPLDRLPAFIVSSLDVSSGYSSAMSIRAEGGLGDLLAWLAVATLFMSSLLLMSWKNRHVDGLTLPIARLIVLAGYLFLSFKAGMVRHDLHSLISWGSLSMAVLLTSHVFTSTPKFFHRGLAALAFILILPGHIQIYNEFKALPFTSLSDLQGRVSNETKAASAFIAQPATWLGNLRAENDASMANIKAQNSLPPLDGTVDIIPSAQSDVIANGLSYSPRPTIQEYTTYTPKLIARNRAFFTGETAPDYLIMTPGSIDGRHPASAEGALWPLFFSRYEAVQSSALGLVLKKRDTPVPDVLGQVVETTASFGEEVAFPNPERTWMVSIGIKPTLLGRLIDLAYRPPMTEITVNYLDGSSGQYRLIPAMAGEGMLLSPYVSNSDDYLLVSIGKMDFPGLKHAKSFVVKTGSRVGVFYDKTFPIRFSAVNGENLQAAEQKEFVQSAMQRASRIFPLMNSNEMHEPTIMRSAEGIFAHAPASLRMPVTPGSTITAFYGMRDGSWNGGGATDGVCFKISSSTGQLAENCLDPANKEANRGEQSMTVTIPEGTTEISLETGCGNSCAWDWSYWGGVEVRASK